MNIECILKRDGGTSTELGGLIYHFEPLDDGAHVAEVTETAHIDRFLSIPEGFKVYHGTGKPKGRPQAGGLSVSALVIEEPKTSAPLAGSDQHPPEFTIAGKTYTQLDVVQMAFAASGLTSDEWNDLGDDERAAKIDIALDDLADATDERAALVAQYEAKFGKKPHGKTSIDTIKAKLAE